MPAWLVLGVLGAGFSFLAAWAARRLLDGSIGWFRAGITSLIVFVAALPFALWSLQSAGILDGDRVTAPTPIALAFFAVTLGWLFAAVVACVVTLELAWPSRGMPNPVTAVREAFHRRDRARRYTEILSIASRHGLALFGRPGHGTPRDLPAAVVSAANEAGVTFIKLGQMLSARDDVLPRELVDALATLQMDSTPIPWAEAEQAIEAELRRPIGEVFRSIDPSPLSAASVAQVHAAQLLDGRDVVIKIQRPRARHQVVTDLDILRRLAADLEKRTTWARDYGTVALVDEFSRSLYDELDYRVELDNIELLRAATAESPHALQIPETYRELSTERMLVQQRVFGTPLSHVSPGELPDDYAISIADRIVAAVLDQVLVRGVFHADLHAGNVILDTDGSPDPARAVTLVDFGAVGIVEKSLRRLLAALLTAMANEDDAGATDIVLLICEAGESLSKSALQRDIGTIITRVHNSTSGADVFQMLVDALRRQRLGIPPSLLLVLRTLGSLDGTLRRLSRRYNLTGKGIQLAGEAHPLALSLRELAMTAEVQLTLFAEGARRMSRRIESISRQLDDGTLTVRAGLFDSADERTWVDGLLARVTITVVGLTLVIAGAMLGASDTGPVLSGDVPAVSFIGSTLGLGGLLLLLRSLSSSFRSDRPRSPGRR